MRGEEHLVAMKKEAVDKIFLILKGRRKKQLDLIVKIILDKFKNGSLR